MILSRAGDQRAWDNTLVDEKEAWQERIEIDPARVAGHPIIRGTRVPVEVLVAALDSGSTIEEVMQDYRVTEADIRAALLFASTTVASKRKRALPHS